MSDSCEGCRFWKKDQDDEEMGLCRRRAPSPDLGNHEAFWPTTFVDDWCGEFQPLPVQQKTEAPCAVPGQAP